METVTIHTTNQTYPVWVGDDLLSECGSLLQNLVKNKSKALIVSDENVFSLYGKKVEEAVSTLLPVHTVIVPPGESSKSMAIYEHILTKALEYGMDRTSVILALGGGVIGDLAGFSAATYMRGIPFIQMPTTLLAHDSSVGGKTGINHPLGKNMIGAFHQPMAVLFDTNTFTTLPDEEWRSGFAEMMKHAYIRDPEFLLWLKEHIRSMNDMKSEAIKQMLSRSIEIKGNIVAEDEKEAGIRAYLNFGHTLGHAIEAAKQYGGITHGEAVAVGILFALRLSNTLGLSSWDVDEEKAWFQNLGYPVDAAFGLDPRRLLETMKKDKKAAQNQIRMVLLKQSGHPTVQAIDETVLKKELGKVTGGMFA